jgi:hypothetical protein
MKTWEGVINKLQERVKNWIYRSLNLAGRLILTKAVLKAILTYMTLVFPSSKGILQKIRAIQRDFLWRGAENKKKMGPGGLGEGLQTKMQRRPRVTRPTSNEQSLWGETLVEMGQINIITMGKPMEGQVFPGHQ